MQEYLKPIFFGISFTSCIVSAAFLAYHGIWGWGWFIFIAFILCTSAS